MPQQNAHIGWTVFVLPSSHNDIGWAGTPSEIAEHRAFAIIDSVLSLMEQDPEFAFTIEAGLYLREYVERRPERVPLLGRFLREGRLESGGSYIQPYEGLSSDEGLIRQIVHGRQWIKETFGVDADGYWNIDVAGRTRQIPQILARSGIRYMVLSRNQPGLYWWQGPDGSRVLVLSFMEGAYGFSPILRPLTGHHSPLEIRGLQAKAAEVSPATIASTLIPLLDRWEPFFEQHQLPRYFLIIAAADYTVPDERLRIFVDRWNREAASGELDLRQLVHLQFGNAAQYIAALEEKSDFSSLEVIEGELPNPWLYIHGPAHHKTVAAMRRAAHYLPAAETFESAAPASAVPDPGIELAWLDYLYPDHGYGGLHGEGTDEVFRQKEESALFRSRHAAYQAMAGISRRLPLQAGAIRGLTVFNALSWNRSDWVETELILDLAEEVNAVRLVDDSGQTVQLQPLDVARSSDGWLLRLRYGFLATDVPSLGFRQYSLIPDDNQLEAGPTKLNSQIPEEFEWANDFARIRLTRGGMVEWFDKQQRRNLISPDFYLGFEVIELGSPGHDVGEGERDISVHDWKAINPFQPTPLGLERTADRGNALQMLEDGPIRTRVMTQSVFSHCVVTQTFSLYRSLDKVDVSIDVQGWDGTHGRELRLMVPFGIPEAEISYDTPFGHVVAGQDEIPPFRSLRPREVQSWIHARGDKLRGTLSSSVVVHDWLDPIGLTSRTVLQAVLLATKRSCHPKGPWYTQAGNHAFKASLSGAPVSLTDRMRFGWNCQRPMDVIFTEANEGREDHKSGATSSIASIDQPNVMISTVKRSDDPAEIIVRCWELEGAPTSASITTSFPVHEVWTCDLLEQELEQLPTVNSPVHAIPITVEPFEILTLKLKRSQELSS